MGANFNTMRVNSTNRDEIKESFYERKRRDEYEYGHDAYNGTFSTLSGIKILNKTFTNRDEAEDYICDRAEKWSDALAVTVQTEDETYTLIGGWCAS